MDFAFTGSGRRYDLVYSYGPDTEGHLDLARRAVKVSYGHHGYADLGALYADLGLECDLYPLSTAALVAAGPCDSRRSGRRQTGSSPLSSTSPPDCEGAGV